MSCTSCSTGKPGGCKSNGGCSTGGCNRLNVHDWLANLPFSDPDSDCRVVEVTFNNGNSRDAFKFDTFTSLAAQCKKFYEDGVGMLGFEVNLNPLGEFVIVRRMCSFEAVPCFSQCQPLTAFCEKHQRCRICGDTLNPAGSSRVYCPLHIMCREPSCKSTPAFKSGFCFGHKRFRPQKKNLVQKSSDQTQPNSKLLKVCEYAFCSELTPLQFCAQHQHECSWGPCKARLDSSHVYVDKPLCLLHTLEGLNSNERSHLEVLLGRPLWYCVVIIHFIHFEFDYFSLL